MKHVTDVQMNCPAMNVQLENIQKSWVEEIWKKERKINAMQAVKTNVLNAEINLIVQAVKRDFIYKLISDGHY